MKRGAKGLTAIEFVIAVALLGILAAVSLPLFLPALRTSRVDGAAGQVIAVLRSAQSMAVGQGSCFGYRSGNDPSAGRPNEYRIERGGCDGSTPAWPAATDTKAGNTRVITDWTSIGTEYSGVNLGQPRDTASVTLGRVVFDSRGASVNPFGASPSYPITISVTDGSGRTRTVQVTNTGSMKFQ